MTAVTARPLQAKRPDTAPPPEAPCELCGEPMGESWGVTRMHEFINDQDTSLKHAEIGELFEYQPIHSMCWWNKGRG